MHGWICCGSGSGGIPTQQAGPSPAESSRVVDHGAERRPEGGSGIGGVFGIEAWRFGFGELKRAQRTRQEAGGGSDHTGTPCEGRPGVAAGRVLAELVVAELEIYVGAFAGPYLRARRRVVTPDDVVHQHESGFGRPHPAVRTTGGGVPRVSSESPRVARFSVHDPRMSRIRLSSLPPWKPCSCSQKRASCAWRETS